MAENKNIEVGGRLHSIATGNVLAGANEILDDSKNKKQSEINTETYSLVNDINERLSGLSPEQQSALSVAAKATDNETKLGYYVCDTEGNIAAKVISNATGYVLSIGGSMKVKMTNANTVNNATLNINSTGAKALYYAGERASANNSWEAGETVEVYYDGTNFYANNIAGNGDDGVFDVSAKYPTSGVEGGNTYTLDGALAVLNANLPASKKKGGMSIKFVQSYDNKYVQYRLMTTFFSTNEADWQVDVILTDFDGTDLDLSDAQENVIARFSNGHIKTKEFDSEYTKGKIEELDEKLEVIDEKLEVIDSSPTENSHNLVESGGVADYVGIEDGVPNIGIRVGENQVEVAAASSTPYVESGNADLSLCDAEKNVIVRFSKGQVETKDFKSSEAAICKDEPVQELLVSDKNGNVALKIKDGNIDTPNFHSLDSIGKDEYIRNRDLNHFAIKDRAMKEWSELQFGLFLHWGVFATGYYEPGDLKFKINGYTLDTYREYIKSYEDQFTSTNWDTDAICQMAKSVGMKYIILTIRHQEGFCLYPSPYANWTVKTSGADEDIVMKLKQSCDKFGLKFGFYIQIMFDIMEEGCYDLGTSESNNNGWFPSDPYTKQQHEAYMKKQMLLLKDLVENIKPYCIFFDGAYSEWPKWYNDIDIISNFVDSYAPYVITNNRDGGSIYYIHDKGSRGFVRGDYWSQEMAADDRIPYRQNQERCAVLTHNWWYSPDYDENIANLRTLPDMLWDIFKTIERGFNYTIDYGPRPDGGIPTPVVTWFGYLKDWCNKYLFFNSCKKTIYYSHQNWGRMALKDNSLWCLICPNRASQFYLDGVSTANIKRVYVYGIESPDSSSNYEVISDDRLLIKNVPLTSDDYFPVVRIDYYTEPSFADYIYTDEETSISGCGFSVSRTNVEMPFAYAQKDSSMKLYYGNSTIVTRFKWDGSDGNYGITLDAVLTAQQVITVNVYSDDDTLLMSDNSLGKDSSDVDTLSTTEKINLINGEIYKLEILRDSNNTNTVVTNLKNITFE